MKIMSKEITPGLHLVEVSGPLTAVEAKTLVQALRELAEGGVKRVVVNLADVSFIDSRGLAALVSGYKMFGSAVHDFRLAAPQDQPKLLFELTGFDRVFQIFENVDQAVAGKESLKVQIPLPVAAGTTSVRILEAAA